MLGVFAVKNKNECLRGFCSKQCCGSSLFHGMTMAVHTLGSSLFWWPAMLKTKTNEVAAKPRLSYMKVFGKMHTFCPLSTLDFLYCMFNRVFMMVFWNLMNVGSKLCLKSLQASWLANKLQRKCLLHFFLSFAVYFFLSLMVNSNSLL